MQAHNQLEAPEKMSLYKKVRPFIYLAVLIGLAIFFKEYILQLLLMIFAIAGIGFILFKAAKYLFKFTSFILRLGISVIAFTVTVASIGWIMMIFV